MKAFNIGIKGVIVRDDKVLILKSADNGYWEVPGGRMEEGEDIHDTLRRELSEELLNIKDIKIGETLAAFKIKHEYRPPTGLMLIFFRVAADFDGEPQISDEHSEYRWVGKQEAIELAEDATKESITKVFEEQ